MDQVWPGIVVLGWGHLTVAPVRLFSAVPQGTGNSKSSIAGGVRLWCVEGPSGFAGENLGKRIEAILQSYFSSQPFSHVQENTYFF